MTAPISQPVLLASDPGNGAKQTWCGADTHFIPGLSQQDATRLPGLSITDRGGVAVVTLRGELDLLGASVLQAYLSGIRWQARARSVADLTDLAFIDCACLSVLVRHCKEIRGQGGSFALAGPQAAVLRVLAVTGLLTWFEVHDTVQEAAAGAGTQRSPALPAAPIRQRATHSVCDARAIPRRDGVGQDQPGRSPACTCGQVAQVREPPRPG